MKIPARYLVAVLILAFAWKGSELAISWPPAPLTQIDTPKPEARLLAWAEPLRSILPKMLPKDRLYLANLYDAMADLQNVRLRLIKTECFADDQRSAIDVLTLALVDGSDK